MTDPENLTSIESAWRQRNWSCGQCISYYMWRMKIACDTIVLIVTNGDGGDLFFPPSEVVSTRIPYVTKAAAASNGGSRACRCPRNPPCCEQSPCWSCRTPRGWELNSTGLTLGGPTLCSWGPHDIPRAMGELRRGEVPEVASSWEGGAGREDIRKDEMRGQSAGGRYIAWYKHSYVQVWRHASKYLAFILSFEITFFRSIKLIMLLPLPAVPMLKEKTMTSRI